MKPKQKKAGRSIPGKSEDGFSRAEEKRRLREEDSADRVYRFGMLALLIAVILIVLGIPLGWLIALGVLIFGLVYSAFA